MLAAKWNSPHAKGLTCFSCVKLWLVDFARGLTLLWSVIQMGMRMLSKDHCLSEMLHQWRCVDILSVDALSWMLGCDESDDWKRIQEQRKLSNHRSSSYHNQPARCPVLCRGPDEARSRRKLEHITAFRKELVETLADNAACRVTEFSNLCRPRTHGTPETESKFFARTHRACFNAR